MKKTIDIPADIPKQARSEYEKNYKAITYKNKQLFLFAADQKIEHLNKDFHGKSIPAEANDPEHLFKIASKGKMTAFASHLGLISQYGKQYSNVNYIVKINGKTNLVPTKQRDPISTQLWSVDDVISFKESSGLNIRGIGYTLYLGSEFEAYMLAQAAQAIHQAHQHGLVTILWVYPRGKAIKDDRSDEIIIGAAGVAASLGSDFVKINYPHGKDKALRIAVQTAGKTGVICSGGTKTSTKEFLKLLSNQIDKGNTAGAAIGRNIFSYKLDKALTITEQIAKIISS